MPENRVYIAKLGKTVGLKGDLKIHIDSDFPKQFRKGAVFTTNKNLNLTILNFNEKKSTIKFYSYENIEKANTLVNQELFTTKDLTKEECKLKENEYFWFDINGCKIIEDDLFLGNVKNIYRYPICDYLEVETQKELVVNKGLPKTFLIPYIPKVYIQKVDIEKKIIYTQNNCYGILENS